MANRIGFIGGGNMAQALVKGLLVAGYDRRELSVGEPAATTRSKLKRRFGVKVSASNDEILRTSDTVVLAVKPQVMAAVLDGLRVCVLSRQLFVSIAAGVRLATLERGLGPVSKVIRVMPNTPCLVGKGASVLCGGTRARRADVNRAKRLFETVGIATVVDEEKLLDAVTGLSGSGPAYVYLFAEALIKAGRACGLDAELAAALAFQTIAGSAAMMLESGASPEALRKAVSSPGGTTVAGLAQLEAAGFSKAVASGVRAATKRSRELAKGGR